MASGGSGSCPQAALSPMTVVLGLCGRWAGTTTSLGTGTLPSAQFPQEAGPFCCSPFSGQGQPQIDTVGAVAAGAQANLPTSGCGVHGVGGGGRYEGAFFFLPRCPGSRAGKWRGKKGMPVVCPSWRPWTPSCPPHAPQTSPCVCHCRMCTRLAVSEGHMATARCSAPAHLASSALRPPPENWPQTRSIQGPVVSAPPTMLHTFWGTIHPPVSIHPSIHPSICSSIYPKTAGVFLQISVSPMPAPVAQAKSFITLHLEVSILQETPSTLGMRRAGHTMMQTHKQV